MGISQTSLKQQGFTIIEMLVVLGVSSLLLILLAAMFRTGMWEVSRSSGRIEVVRMGRQALDNIQRYLASTVPPTNLTDPGGNPVTEAIYVPLNTDIFDPYSMTNPTPTSRIMFYTPMDHLAGTPMPGARQLQLNPVNFAYEIGLVQGLNNEGQDLVLRKMQAPTNADPRPVTYDASVQPRFLARRLGIPDAGAPGGYRDGLVVQRWREGALQITVNVSSAQISDDLNRNRTEAYTPIVITMTSIYQPPIFNVQ